MLRKMLGICSLFALFMVLTVIAAHAQTTTATKTHTPPDFETGQKTRQSNDAAVGQAQGVSEIQDRQNEKSRLGLMNSGDVAREIKVSKSASELLNNQFTLVEVITPDAGAKIQKSKLKEPLRKEKKTFSEIATIPKQD